ncbi:MAG TPA: serine/threonine-protein kinase [Candidatus Nanopelagicales bacterium]|nr:serine/threonine-protein kinase [Candidatus Nanopelagicales bacterium]
MIGETLGQRYEIVRLLGQGGMGSVYEAEHRETRERVAVKVLHGHVLEQGGEGPRRFRREAEAASAIGGEHVARVLDAGTDAATGRMYLVTEHLEGEDLQRLLDRVGPLAPEAALRVALQALAGLRDAHAAGVVHRDIKPANIFLARREGGAICVKLLDFGIAKIRADALGLPHGASLTTTAGFLGSPLYMSPEQVESSRDVDHRTDIWSLGSVLYATLAGRAPYEHLGSLGQLLVAICISAPPPLSEIAPWVPAAIADVVHRALTLAPGARTPSAVAMLDAIRRLVPSGALREEMLVASGERPRDVIASTVPPSPMPSGPLLSGPKVVVALDLDRPVRGDEMTEHAVPAGLAAGQGRGADPSAHGTLSSAPSEGELRQVARSAVPAVGARAGGRQITVDPRHFLGQKSELWTFSLDVHRHVSSLVARIWKALRRAGAKVPPMTYGTAWVLFEPRTGRTIPELGEGLERVSLEAAGIRPGTVLWVVEPGADPRFSSAPGS